MCSRSGQNRSGFFRAPGRAHTLGVQVPRTPNAALKAAQREQRCVLRPPPLRVVALHLEPAHPAQGRSGRTRPRRTPALARGCQRRHLRHPLSASQWLPQHPRTRPQNHSTSRPAAADPQRLILSTFARTPLSTFEILTIHPTNKLATPGFASKKRPMNQILQLTSRPRVWLNTYCSEKIILR